MDAIEPQRPSAAPGHIPRYTGRQVAGLFVILFGFAVLGSAAFFNPWLSRIWKGTGAVEYAEVLWSYFLWAAFLGAGAIVLGNVLSRSGSPRWGSLTALYLVLACLILFDRFLLTRFGLPFWTYDPVLHYRNRPDVRWTLSSFGRPDDIVRINRYGFHDDDFPVEKPEGEFRILALGDSVTMGYGVTYRETFSSQLEESLRRQDKRHRSHQVINCGVHGYSTTQELQILRESLRFGPDLIVLGFCMNDVTEPFIIDRELGGTGIDYHGVVQTSNRLLGYILNETGFGRLLQKFQWRKKSIEAEKRLEEYNVREMAEKSETEPRFREAWGIVFKALEEIYSIGRERKIPVLIAIFPFDFQLLDERLRTPQRMLTEHAARNGADVLDLAEPFRKAIFEDEELLAFLRGRGYADDQIRRFYDSKYKEYFFDEDHLTEKGHAIVAQNILKYLTDHGLAGDR